MNDLLSEWISILIRTTLIVAAAALLAAALLWLLRVRSPAVHRFVWLVVLLQGWVVSPWAITWTIAPTVASVEQPPQREGAESAAMTAGLDNVLYDEDRSDNCSEPVAAANDVSAGAVTTPIETSLGLSLPPWQTALAVVWLAGILLVALRFAWRYWQFVRSLPASLAADAHWQQQADAVGRELGLGRSIPLHITESLGPALCRLPGGYRLLVPAPVWRQLSAAQRQAVLRHELAHYLRGDVWKSLLVRILALPHWFNPFAWWAAQQFEESAEWACDGYALRGQPADAPAYARALLSFNEPDYSFSSLHAAARGGPLAQRVRRLLSPLDTEESPMKRMSIIGLSLLLASLGLFQLRFVAAEPPASDASDSTAPAPERPTPATDTATADPFAAQSGSAPATDTATADPFAARTGSAPAAELEPLVTAAGKQDENVERSSPDKNGHTDGAPPLATKSGSNVPSSRQRYNTSDVADYYGTRLLDLRNRTADREAVVDMSRVFKASRIFKQRTEALKAKVSSADQSMKQKRKAIESLQGVLKAPETNREAKVAIERTLQELAQGMQHEAQLSRQALIQEEATIYNEVYDQVVAEIARYAKENGIRLVRRSQSVVRRDEQIDPTDHQAVIKRMNRDIIYVESEQLDITDAIIARLNGRTAKAGESTR